MTKFIKAPSIIIIALMCAIMWAYLQSIIFSTEEYGNLHYYTTFIGGFFIGVFTGIIITEPTTE